MKVLYVVVFRFKNDWVKNHPLCAKRIHRSVFADSSHDAVGAAIHTLSGLLPFGSFNHLESTNVFKCEMESCLQIIAE